MGWVTGVIVLLMGLLLLWAFSAVLISSLAGLAVSALLWQPVRFWRRRQLQRAQALNPALDLHEELQNHPALLYVLTTVIILLGVAVMLLTLITLPETMFSPEQLSLGAGIAFMVTLGTLIKQIGNLTAVGEPAKAAADIRASWSLAAWLVPMFTIVVLIFFVPNTAGWMSWREEWRGYPSTQLRIPLKSDDAQSREALLELLNPLLIQGSRVVSYRARSRSGSSYTLSDAVPARYRFRGAAMEIQLGGLMPADQLRLHLESLDMAARGDIPSPSLLAYAQCQPSQEKLARSRFLSQGRQMMQELQSCVQSRTATMRDMLEKLKDNLQPSQVQQTLFNPKRSNWLGLGGWKAVDLPEGDELLNLDTLR